MELKRNGIPVWMIILNLVVLMILLWKSWAVFADPAAIFGQAAQYDSPHRHALWELGGRNLAMIAVSLWSLFRPSKVAYIAVFLMGLVREGADMLFGSGLLPGDGGVFHPAAASFLIFLVAYAVALRKLSHD